MRKILFMVIFVLFSSLVLSEVTPRSSVPPWFLQEKSFSMNNSFSFMYSSNDGSLRSIYNNYLMYRVSPNLSLFGNIGYYKKGMDVNNYGGMLQGFGFEYRLNSNLLFHFQYQGIIPLNKRVGSKK